MSSYLPIVAFAAPLGTDSAAVSTAMGAKARIVWRRRLIIAATLTAFEAGMPAVGYALGGVLPEARWTAWIAGAMLVGLGALMLRPDGDDDGDDAPDSGIGFGALLGVGLAVSVDEVAVGAALSLDGVPLLPLVVTIAAWVGTATLSGLTLGARIGERFHDHAGRAAAAALIVLGLLVGTGIL